MASPELTALRLMENTCDCLLQKTDRLSYLPDSVLYHILSFLETKYAVQTSVLSRRWRCSWKHVPALNIRSKSFKEYARFRTYVDKILSLRYPLSLREITFVDEGNSEDREGSLFARVIQYGFSRDAKHLVFDLQTSRSPQEDPEYFLSELFGTTSDCNFETLKLDTFVLDFEFKSSGFRMLTKLELLRCMFLSDDEELVDAFSEFPCLEHLVLNMPLPEDDVDDKRFRISGLRLLSLSITDTYFKKLEIDAPKLEYFYFQKFWDFVEFKELNLPSLNHAEISVDNGDCTDKEEYMDYAKHGLMSLLHGLSNATALNLCCFTLKVLSCIPEFLEQQRSPFTRLEILSLGTDDVPDAVIDYFVKAGSSGSLGSTIDGTGDGSLDYPEWYAERTHPRIVLPDGSRRPRGQQQTAPEMLAYQILNILDPLLTAKHEDLEDPEKLRNYDELVRRVRGLYREYRRQIPFRPYRG